MTPEAARQIVLARYPDAFVCRGTRRFTIRTPLHFGELVRSSYTKTESAAWLSAARRIEREPVERTP